MENENVKVENSTNEGSQEERTERTYTEAEVKELLQRESDRRTTSALKKQAEKYERQISLSKLDENSRLSAEKDDKIRELTERLANYVIEKNKSELKSVLSARGLSAQFADIIHITDDIEESQSRIDTLDKLFREAVASEVKKRLATNAPQVGSDGSGTIDFSKMTLTERQKLYNSNPELYRKLAGK